ncbi:hypothetical protein BT69DRAFT_1278180 [Atractiella rhizophila]|nr:hypothetical protein BT69DRAFT_1278180 [Atractiella rhizophila]
MAQQDPNRPHEAYPARGPPSLKKGLRASTFRQWQKYSGTFVYGMLDPWEIVLLHLLYFMVFALIAVGVFRYFPQHVRIIANRMLWYWYGEEAGMPTKMQLL